MKYGESAANNFPNPFGVAAEAQFKDVKDFLCCLGEQKMSKALGKSLVLVCILIPL